MEKLTFVQILKTICICIVILIVLLGSIIGTWCLLNHLISNERMAAIIALLLGLWYAVLLTWGISYLPDNLIK